MDWIHCNHCLRLPSSQSRFFLTSCSHILCQKCSHQDEARQTHSQQMCAACNVPAKLIEINRSLKPEMMLYFKAPKELASQYMHNLKSVLDFQDKQRSRFMKAQQDKCNKAVKFATELQSAMKKKAAAEKLLVEEKNAFAEENEKNKAAMKAMEEKLAQQSREIERLSRHPSSSTPRTSSQKRYPSLNGNTPIQPLSFDNIFHSTPIDGALGSKKRRPDPKTSTPLQDLFGRLDNSVIASDIGTTTPFMLGLQKKPATSGYTEKSPNFGNFFD